LNKYINKQTLNHDVNDMTIVNVLQLSTLQL